MSNLKPLVWRNQNPEDERIFVEHSQGAGIFYTVHGAEQDGYGAIWHDQMEGSHGKKYGFESIRDAKRWIATDHYPHKMQPYINPDSITDIADWFKKAKPEPTDKDICVQLGCHFEEIVEMLDELKEDEANPIMHEIANYMKSPDGGEVVALDDKVNFLDALCDQIVTATGVAYMMGFDIEGALKEVIRSNNSKMVDGKFEFDANGKIAKPESYSKPDLTPFVSTMQILHKGE